MSHPFHSISPRSWISAYSWMRFMHNVPPPPIYIMHYIWQWDVRVTAWNGRHSGDTDMSVLHHCGTFALLRPALVSINFNVGVLGRNVSIKEETEKGGGQGRLPPMASVTCQLLFRLSPVGLVQPWRGQIFPFYYAAFHPIPVPPRLIQMRTVSFSIWMSSDCNTRLMLAAVPELFIKM